MKPFDFQKASNTMLGIERCASTSKVSPIVIWRHGSKKAHLVSELVKYTVEIESTILDKDKFQEELNLALDSVSREDEMEIVEVHKKEVD